MILQWTEYDAYDVPRKCERPDINVRNANEYAKGNCRKCNGRGYLSVDHGNLKTVRMDTKTGYPVLYSERRNEHVIACTCVLRTLSKLKVK